MHRFKAAEVVGVMEQVLSKEEAAGREEGG